METKTMKTITIEIPDGKKAEWVNGVLTLVDDKPQEPNEQIPTFADAVRYLGMEEGYYSSTLDTVLENKEFQKKIEAYTKLLTIATAWNKIDGFEADFSDKNQYKYFPWFEYSRVTAGFVCAYRTYAATDADAVIGSRLCFKTSERAKQFGEQFIDLWNDFLK